MSALRPHTAVPLAALLLALPVAARTQENPRSVQELFGPSYTADANPSLASTRPALRSNAAADRFRYWNQVAVDTSGLDHTPVAPGESRVFGHQLGPGRSSKAMALAHIAMFDAINSIRGGYVSYTRARRAASGASVHAAIAQAAHDTLIAAFPSHSPRLGEILAEDLLRMPGSDAAKQAGASAGSRAAAAILAMRANDGSHHPEPRIGIEYIPGSGPGLWRQDPISLLPVAMGAHWGEVRPFVLRSARQFRVPPPPRMTSQAYARAYDEVQRLGGDGLVTPTERTADQTEAGIYWAYDGTPSLCAPPRLYNQITTTVSGHITDVSVLARLFALVNVAMADAGIAIWESKYHHKTWRPVTGIRESDPGTGPSGLGDGNPATLGDPTFSPLGAPASNLLGPNFTPPFPAYPSGHAGFGGALFQILRRFYGRDRVAFTFVSDELNGTTLDNQGNVRPRRPRSFRSFSQAEEENGQSRIYLGIHWSFDKTKGIEQGRQVADWVFNHSFRPVRR